MILIAEAELILNTLNKSLIFSFFNELNEYIIENKIKRLNQARLLRSTHFQNVIISQFQSNLIFILNLK